MSGRVEEGRLGYLKTAAFCRPSTVMSRSGEAAENHWEEKMEHRNRAEGKNIFLFDLDGTLTDPAQGITKSVQYALR